MLRLMMHALGVYSPTVGREGSCRWCKYTRSLHGQEAPDQDPVLQSSYHWQAGSRSAARRLTDTQDRLFSLWRLDPGRSDRRNGHISPGWSSPQCLPCRWNTSCCPLPRCGPWRWSPCPSPGRTRAAWSRPFHQKASWAAAAAVSGSAVAEGAGPEPRCPLRVLPAIPPRAAEFSSFWSLLPACSFLYGHNGISQWRLFGSHWRWVHPSPRLRSSWSLPPAAA